MLEIELGSGWLRMDGLARGRAAQQMQREGGGGQRANLLALQRVDRVVGRHHVHLSEH